MTDSGRLALVIAVIAAYMSLIAGPAMSYIGPGAGLTAIGTVLALIGAVVLAIFGFVWYPIKRYMRKRRQSRTKAK
ncbi:MAG: hypothetical protein IH996_01865 [Proteobacteria bacterium]|nr:hypothetical protein [Pseudomonadota bacterium]